MVLTIRMDICKNTRTDNPKTQVSIVYGVHWHKNVKQQVRTDIVLLSTVCIVLSFIFTTQTSVSLFAGDGQMQIVVCPILSFALHCCLHCGVFLTVGVVVYFVVCRKCRNASLHVFLSIICLPRRKAAQFCLQCDFWITSQFDVIFG